MAKKAFVESVTQERIDRETGEIIRCDIKKTHIVRLDPEDKFVQIYYEMLRTFYSIKYVSDLKLIIELASMANYNTGEIDLSTKKREVLCDRLGIKKTHLSTSLKRLKELNLIRGEKGSYIIEEAVFWKGDKETRKELMKEKDFEFVIQFKL